MKSPLAAFAILSALTFPAAAIEENTPEPEWRYRVVGIDAGNALNVRAQPGPRPGVIGRLPHDAAGLVVTGVRAEAAGSVWWQIAAPGRPDRSPGWVSARHLTPEDPHGAREDGFPLACVGTEPFWSLEIAGDAARLSIPDEDDRHWRAGGWTTALGQWGRFAIRFDDGAAPGYAAITRTYRFCSDGMSDFQYPYDATVIIPDGTVLGGCCRRAQ